MFCPDVSSFIPKEKEFIECDNCGAEIYIGEKYYFIKQEIFCKDCIERLSKVVEENE